MNLFKRLEGVFFNPRETFAAIAEKPVWIDAFILLLIAVIAFSYITTPYIQQDQLEMFRDNVKLKERLGDDGFNQMIRRMENPTPASRIIQTFVTVPLASVIGFFFSTLMLFVFGRFVSAEGRYMQVLAVLLHASFVDKLLGNAVRLILIQSKKSVMKISTGLPLFFPDLEVTSTAYIVLSQFDFFQLWMFGVLGWGLSAVFKVDIRKGLILSYGFWLLKSLVYIGFGILGRSFMQ